MGSMGSEIDDDNMRFDSDEESCNARLRKKKRVASDECSNVLSVTILHAEGIDNPNTNPPVTNRIYKVVSWLENGYLPITPEVYGLPDPQWNKRYFIQLENPVDCKFLYLEIIRTHSWSDPGTSSGEALVGRVRIPLPKPSSKVAGRFGLVRLEGKGCKAEGHIVLSMEMTN